MDDDVRQAYLVVGTLFALAWLGELLPSDAAALVMSLGILVASVIGTFAWSAWANRSNGNRGAGWKAPKLQVCRRSMRSALKRGVYKHAIREFSAALITMLASAHFARFRLRRGSAPGRSSQPSFRRNRVSLLQKSLCNCGPRRSHLGRRVDPGPADVADHEPARMRPWFSPSEERGVHDTPGVLRVMHAVIVRPLRITAQRRELAELSDRQLRDAGIDPALAGRDKTVAVDRSALLRLLALSYG
jgi:uncharacterized protein YjiS (DUF1127 family)